MEFSIAAILANFTDDKLIAPKALEKKLDAQEPEVLKKLNIALDALEKIGVLEKDKGRYRRVQAEDVVEAKLRCSSKGFCFAIQDVEGSEDVYIRESHLSTAWNGDRVLVKIIKEGSRRRSPEGEVQLILERANPSVLARIKNAGGLYRAVPLDDRLLFELDLIDQDPELGTSLDHLVHVEVIRYPLGVHRPLGRVVQILGSDAETADALDIVCCKHDLPRTFSESVMAAVEGLPSKPKRIDIKNRVDFRKLLTVAWALETPLTLPPITDRAKVRSTPDQDLSLGPIIEHAFSVESLKGGKWQVGIHITDATWWVAPETPIDREARKRGMAVYLGETLIPMLPDVLITNNCSLIAGQERLAMSILLTIDKNGNLLEFEMQPSVIQVDYQVTYEQSYQLLASEDENIHPAATVLYSFMNKLFDVSQAVRQARSLRGSFELNLPDAHCHFDDEGELGAMLLPDNAPIRAALGELIILTNQAIASHLQALGVPGIYRIQPTPELNDMQELVKLANNLGVDVAMEDEEEVKSIDLQNFTRQIVGHKSEKVLSYLLEDTLKSCAYSIVPKPHFGLALNPNMELALNQSYTHCTSPLSCYADLLILRVLQLVLEQGRSSRTARAKEKVNLGHSECHGQINWNVLPPEIQHELESDLASIVVHLTERERIAQDAEDDWEGLQKTGLMRERVGQTLPGLITGVQSYGFFVEISIPNNQDKILRVEGLVHVSSLKDDWYEYRSRQQTLVGRKNRNQYRLGDKVEVQVKSVDYYRQQIDLVAVGGGSSAFDEEDDF